VNDQVYVDAFNLLCGEKLGDGYSREVFRCKLRPDLVVKVEAAEYRTFANVHEMQFWDDNQFCKKISAWLAPCEYLSPDGRLLLQKRCDPIPSTMKMPFKVPAFMADLKRDNFGLLDGKIVCIDYALTDATPSMRLKKSHLDD
jgi:hypothetical protein